MNQEVGSDPCFTTPVARDPRCRARPSIDHIHAQRDATGYHLDFLSTVDIRGRNGLRLSEFWGDSPSAYRGGLVPEAGSAWFLPKLVGLPQALRWAISGRTFGADEALSGGLVSELTEPADLLGRAKEIAQELTAETSAVSVALTRQMLWRFAGAPDPFELLRIDAPISRERGAHADVREGVASFLEKRTPVFPGKVSQDMPSQYPWWDES